MNFSHYTDQVLTLAVELVNEVSRPVGDVVRSPADLDRVLARFGATSHGRSTRRDLDEVRLLCGRLRQVFTAGDEAAAAALLNDLVAEADVTPQLTDHDGTWHLHYTPAGTSRSRSLQASCAMALMALVADDGLSRLKTCQADDCEDLIVDTTRNQSRRYCSDRCCSRENVAAFRARRRSGGD